MLIGKKSRKRKEKCFRLFFQVKAFLLIFLPFSVSFFSFCCAAALHLNLSTICIMSDDCCNVLELSETFNCL